MDLFCGFFMLVKLQKINPRFTCDYYLSHMRKVVIICALTGELLTGAKVGDEYSDFNGEVNAKMADTVHMVSYKDAVVESDTVFLVHDKMSISEISNYSSKMPK